MRCYLCRLQFFFPSNKTMRNYIRNTCVITYIIRTYIIMCILHVYYLCNTHITITVITVIASEATRKYDYAT